MPIPAALLKHLPKAIKGKPFAGSPNSASTRLGKWLRDECKITNSTKVAAHSYRHRAKDQLRKAGVHPDVQEEIFGRDKKAIAAGYGFGSQVPLLRKVIDRIGFDCLNQLRGRRMLPTLRMHSAAAWHRRRLRPLSKRRGASALGNRARCYSLSRARKARKR